MDVRQAKQLPLNQSHSFRQNPVQTGSSHEYNPAILWFPRIREMVRFDPIFTMVLGYCLSSCVAVGRLDYLDQCIPDFEEDYHIKKDPEFRGHKFLCMTERNLECNFLQNISHPDRGNDSATNEPTWLCGCEPNSTYIEFGKARYWRKIIEEVQLSELDLDVYDILNQSSLFYSKCVMRLNAVCQSDENCPPNAICIPNQDDLPVCQCRGQHISILEACFYYADKTTPENSSYNRSGTVENPFNTLGDDETTILYSSGSSGHLPRLSSMIFYCYVIRRYFL